ncbi:MAG: helix-turn-helix transcriptional regulator [Candidatus Melainabacteria bacterium]|nr:helix-turn-helix transcriptional regulator [Candidatus Melainabacteria bacterium]
MDLYGVQLEKKIYRRFGKRVKELRLRSRLSQEDFADQAGIDSSYLGKVERGERNPSLGVVARIAKAFGITLAELLVGV